MAATTSIDLQAGRYHGDDLEAVKAFSEIQTNWTRLKNTLTSGGLPSLMAKITSAYSSGYSWVEMYEITAGTFAVLAGGRVSGAGGWPKAFETNSGTADFTNDIVELLPSTDVTTGATTVSFDAHGPRLAANDRKVIPDAGLTYVGTTLTLKRNLIQNDINGKISGVGADTDLTVTIAGGSFDAYQESTLVEAGVSRVTIPTTNGSSTILEFVDDINPSQIKLELKASTQYKVIIGGASNWEIGYPRFH